MTTINQWLDEYGASHRNPTNKALHWVCVPLIVLSLLGLMWSVPVPAAFTGVSALLNWATIFMGFALLYYLSLSVPLALGMVAVTAGMIAILAWADSLATPLWLISVVVFVAAWIGQFIGHIVEGKRPSFFKDVQFLMIGPIWLLSFIYQRIGLRY